MVIGGLPFLKHFDLDEEASHKYLRDVYNTVVMKDVLEANKIRDVKLFNRILHYAIENISHTFSANRLSQFLKNEHIKISVDSVLSYLQYCKNAYILKQVSRYKLLGKQILKVDEKYFITDHGLRQALGYSNIKDIERTLENIVYNELISRGYKVWIGKVNNHKIDFVAQKDGKSEYYQVSYLMESQTTRDREFNVYEKVTDNYPKFVLSMDTLNFSQKGIIHLNIIDFLLS